MHVGDRGSERRERQEREGGTKEGKSDRVVDRLENKGTCFKAFQARTERQMEKEREKKGGGIIEVKQ